VPVILTRYPIAYHATPKVACTSIKLALYELEYGRPFEPRQDGNGRWKHIHNSWQGGTPYFAPVPTPKSYFKFAVVRDPLERFLSAFANRVIYHDELGPKNLCHLKGELVGLRPNPSLSEFIADLDRYRAASWQIRHHTDPQINFIGRDLLYYDRIFDFTELAKIPDALKVAADAQITLPHEQSGGPKLSMAELSKKQLERLSDFYAEDYLLLADFYQAG
jgi:Sulfotransferase family